MFQLIATVSILFAALFFLATAVHYRRPRRRAAEGACATGSRWAMLASWVGFALALLGFSASYGLEVGLAWFLLWSALAAMAATLLLSLRPAGTLWAAGFCTTIALVTVVL
ncbi:MAG: hypothetical protein AAGE94_03475 [Acidobacteriota bacterium]